MSSKEVENLKQQYEQMTERLNELNRTIATRQNELIDVQFKISQTMNQYIQLQETRDKLQQEIVQLRLVRQSLVKENETPSSSDSSQKEPSNSNLIKETTEDITESPLSSSPSLPFVLSPKTVPSHRRRLVQRRFSTTYPTTHSHATLSGQDSKTSNPKSNEPMDNDEMPMPNRSRSRSSLSGQSSPPFSSPATFNSSSPSSPETPRNCPLNSNTNDNNNDNNKSSVQQIISKLNSATMADEFIPMPVPQRKATSPLLQRRHSINLSPPSSKK